MMSTPSRLMHSSTIFAPGSFTVASMGAPTWPPHSSSEGGYAPLGLPRPRSGRPGAAVAPLDTPTYSMGAPTWPPHSSSEGGYAPLGLPRPRSGRPGGAGAAPRSRHPSLRIRRALGGGLARPEARLRRAQPRARNHERRTGHVRHPYLVAELHRRRP